MATPWEATRPPIDDLFHLLKFSKAGYELAYDRAHDLRLRGLFGALASGRVLLLAELEREVVLRSNCPVWKLKFMKTSMHRVWTDIRNAFLLLGDRSLLAECARGERYILALYERHGSAPDMDVATKALLARQRKVIDANLADIELLKEASRSMA